MNYDISLNRICNPAIVLPVAITIIIALNYFAAGSLHVWPGSISPKFTAADPKSQKSCLDLLVTILKPVTLCREENQVD